jgi:hypothetical protein
MTRNAMTGNQYAANRRAGVKRIAEGFDSPQFLVRVVVVRHGRSYRPISAQQECGCARESGNGYPVA